MSDMRNWAGNVEYASDRVAAPASIDELLQLTATAPALQGLGTRHSFSRVADTAGIHVTTEGLGLAVELDGPAGCARVPGHVRYGDLATLLAAEGLAVANLASLPHISVAGAVSTSTHGSGDRNGTLATSVRAVELATSTGELVRLQRGDGDFEGAVVALGALGVMTIVELDVEPAFEVRQDVIDGASRARVREGFEEIFSSAYSVSLFTPWAADGLGQLWVKQRRSDATDIAALCELSGGQVATAKRHPVPGHDPVNCTEQGQWGPSHDRLPHFRMDFTPSSGNELQTEYLVPRDQAVEALAALEALAPDIAPLLMVTEVRTMAADSLWLSGAYGRDTVGIHFTWKPDERVHGLLPGLERTLGAVGGRPHWGKVFRTPAASLEARYPRYGDFRDLRSRLDPRGAFATGFLRECGLAD